MHPGQILLAHPCHAQFHDEICVRPCHGNNSAALRMAAAMVSSLTVITRESPRPPRPRPRPRPSCNVAAGIIYSYFGTFIFRPW